MAAIWLLSSGCQARKDLHYHFASPDGDCRLQKNNGKNHCYLYLNDRVLIHTHRSNALEYTAIYYPDEVLHRFHRYIGASGPKPGRDTGLVFVSVSLLNLTQKPMEFDARRFRLRGMDTDRVHKPVSPQTYTESYYGHHTGNLPYYFVYAPHPARAFLQKIPSWYDDVYSNKTGSPHEKKELEKEQNRWTQKHIESMNLIQPGQEIRVILPFIRYKNNSQYSFYYNSDNQNNAANPLPAPSIHFLYNLTVDEKGEFKQSGPGMDPDERKARAVFRAFWKDVDIQRADLLNMHRQLRNHQKLQAEQNK